MCDVRLDTEGQKRERLFLLDNRRQLPVDRTQRFQIRPLELPRIGGEIVKPTLHKTKVER